MHCHMSNRIKSFLCICLSAALISGNTHADKSNEQIAVEVLDGICVLNYSDYSIIDKMIAAKGGQVLKNEFTMADPVMERMGGKTFSLNEQGVNFIVAYANGGGCTVIAEKLDHSETKIILENNYRMKTFKTIAEGMQIQDIYEFSKDSLYAGGYITVLRAKESTGNTMVSISYLPYENMKNAINKPDAGAVDVSGCTLTEDKKQLLRDGMCQGNTEYSSTTGIGCQVEMLRKRTNDTAIQIVAGKKCGFEEYANTLKSQLDNSMSTIGTVFRCIEVEADVDEIVEQSMSRAERIVENNASYCTNKMRSRLSVRLPELIRLGESEVSQQQRLLENIGAR